MSEESTTPDLVELGDRLLEAANRHDLDAIMHFFAPDAVWEGLVPGDERLRGLTAIRGLLQDWFANFAELSVERELYLDLGNGVHFPSAPKKLVLLAAAARFDTETPSSGYGWMAWSYE